MIISTMTSPRIQSMVAIRWDGAAVRVAVLVATGAVITFAVATV
jgi:hypothetical protein